MENSIESALTVLAFKKGLGEQLRQTTFDAYHQQILNHFSRLGRQLEQTSPGFLQFIEESGAMRLKSFVLAPEFTHLLGMEAGELPGQIDGILRRAILAEKAKETGSLEGESALWSMRGDFFIGRHSGQDNPFTFEAPTLLEHIPIDFMSPYCSFLSNDEMGESKDSEVRNYTFDEIDSIIDHLEMAVLPIQDAYPILESFLALFSFHIVLKVNPNLSFSSGSNGNFVGRIVLANIEKSTRETLVEALVHEAAHAYLYMLEELNPWMPGEKRSIELGRVVESSWTGNGISLRSFAQAIFIWYSLYNFWSGCQERGLYDREFIDARLRFIEKGFQKLNLDKINQLADGSLPLMSLEAFEAARNEIVSSKIKKA